MSNDMTPSQEAAAFHGMSINRARSVDERLELALQALSLYEAEVERLRGAGAARYDLAIMYLRDAEAFWKYVQDEHPLGEDEAEFATQANHVAADYLLTRLPEEDQ